MSNYNKSGKDVGVSGSDPDMLVLANDISSRGAKLVQKMSREPLRDVLPAEKYCSMG